MPSDATEQKPDVTPERSTAGRAAARSETLDRVRIPDRPARVPDQIADALRAWIIREADAGDMLPTERELVERFGVARPTVREAMRSLQAEGLIAIKRGVNGGAIVQPPQVHDLAVGVGVFLQRIGATMTEVFDLRLLLEPEAARRAAKRADVENVASLLDEILDEERDELKRPQPASVSRRIVDFHNVVLALGGDRVLATFGELLETVVVMQNVRSLVTADEPSRWALDAHRAHRRIADAIKAGDGEGAARISKKHLEASARMIIGDEVDLTVDVVANTAGGESHDHWPSGDGGAVHRTGKDSPRVTP